MESVNFTGASNGTDISVGAKFEDNNIAIQAASLLAYKVGMSMFTATVINISGVHYEPLNSN